MNIWHKTLFPKSEVSFKDIPSYKTGGWGSWDFEKSRTEKILKERKEYNVYYLYDKDYNTEETIENRYREAKQKNINLHIWKRKEIENYLIDINVICRIINQNEAKRVSCEELQNIIEAICNELKKTVIDQYANQQSRKEKGKEIATVFREAEQSVEKNWNSWEYKIATVSGKELIKRLINLIKERYNIQLTMTMIAKEFKSQEISEEVVDIISKIENQKNFYSTTFNKIKNNRMVY